MTKVEAVAGEICSEPMNCKVILVEDDLLLQTVLGMQMRIAGIKFCAASEGNEALRMIRSHCPEVLVLDVSLPGLTGFEIVESLRHDPVFLNCQKPKVIVYTGMDLTEEERGRLSTLGKTTFYTKLIDNEDMGVMVKRLLAA
ncbi:MAG: response regulator [Candidatus Obscuribacterales bacterium]|jgi:CheY-like chemotaxis protein